MCAGCNQTLPKREYLTCMLCADAYDLECANVSSQRFYNTMTNEHKQAWKCQLCICKMPKTGNTNTPVRSQQSVFSSSEDTNNITQRNKTNHIHNISALEDSILSTLGDTIQESHMPHATHNTSTTEIRHALERKDSTITMQQFNLLLQQNNKSIIDAITDTIHKEIDAAISQFGAQIIQKIDTLNQNQTKIEQEVRVLDKQIGAITHRLNELQEECKQLQKYIQTYDSKETKPHEDSNKTMVLHGLPETYWETENDLTDRITNIFYDILNVDLTGYIEETSRIGRNGPQRPIKIELISKRKTKQILENTQYFRGTGLALTEHLSKIALQERKLLKIALQNARKTGKHAIIRNNRLIIDGQEATPQKETYSIPNSTRTSSPLIANPLQENGHHSFRTGERENLHQPHTTTFRTNI